jgi:hypothetical protein
MPWSTRLRHPIHLTDGRILRTLCDARDMLSSLPERDQQLDKRQRVSALFLSASQSDNSMLVAAMGSLSRM